MKLDVARRIVQMDDAIQAFVMTLEKLRKDPKQERYYIQIGAAGAFGSPLAVFEISSARLFAMLSFETSRLKDEIRKEETC